MTMKAEQDLIETFTELGGPFRIARVAELTGVPEPTLRAWERRYGVPSPLRTTTGYRLYGPSEVEEVRTMRELCDKGLAAAEAARAVLERRAHGAGQAPPDGESSEALSKTPYDAVLDAMLDAVERFDDAALEENVRRLPLLGGVLTILDRVVTPLLYTVGERWHSGELTIAQEHMLSQRMSAFVRDMLHLTRADGAPNKVLLACFEDDDHELGLLVTSVRFAVWGMRPIFLGARMPPEALASAVESTSPCLVALSLTIAPQRARARELCRRYAEACDGVPWIVGGPGAEHVSSIIEQHGGHVAPGELEPLRRLVEQLRRSTDRGSSPRERTKR